MKKELDYTSKLLRDVFTDKRAKTLDYFVYIVKKNDYTYKDFEKIIDKAFPEKEISLDERNFNKTVFLGAGEFSYQMINRLHLTLDKGLSWLGGSQQPIMSTEAPWTEEDDKFMEQVEIKIENAVRDIAMALTGKEITFITKEKGDEDG